MDSESSNMLRHLPPRAQREILKAKYYFILRCRRAELFRGWKKIHRVTDALEQNQSGEVVTPGNPSIGEKIEGLDDLAACVLGVLEELPDIERNVIVLRHQGDSFKEIAEKLKLNSESTARSHYRRGLHRWRMIAFQKCGVVPVNPFPGGSED